jgi:hypothetical protein
VFAKKAESLQQELAEKDTETGNLSRMIELRAEEYENVQIELNSSVVEVSRLRGLFCDRATNATTVLTTVDDFFDGCLLCGHHSQSLGRDCCSLHSLLSLSVTQQLCQHPHETRTNAVWAMW